MKYVFTFFLIFHSAFVFAQGIPTFANVQVELDEGQTLPIKGPISFVVTTPHPDAMIDRLLQWEGIKAKKVAEKQVLLTITRQPNFTGKLLDQYLQDSFVIDISEQSTQSFISGFAKNRVGELNELAEYVHNYLENPTYIHGFNIASNAAQSKSGDCTEYAVLTTALARSLSIPARVIIGTVLFDVDDQIVAVGHAWTEVYRDGNWHIVDAALYGLEASLQFYVPAAALAREDPGFQWALAMSGKLIPERITKLRSAH